MRTKTIKIDDDVREVLSRPGTIEGENVVLQGQLPRPLYEKVDKVLKAAGGKWNRSFRAHRFPDGVRPAEVLGLALETGGIVDVKKTEGQFFTPPDLARDIVRGINGLGPGVRVLEPSAGEGALAIAAAATGARVTCVEKDERLAGILESYGYDIECRDFLSMTCLGGMHEFDVVVMNPPFADDQDIAHVEHALKFLKPRGRLVAIMSPGFTMPGKNKRRNQFASLVDEIGEWHELPEGSFKDSGTNVRTVLVTLTKPADESRV